MQRSIYKKPLLSTSAFFLSFFFNLSHSGHHNVTLPFIKSLKSPSFSLLLDFKIPFSCFHSV